MRMLCLATALCLALGACGYKGPLIAPTPAPAAKPLQP
ncbi:lipoprotein [Aquaspirillum sp. LM1]